ncbi:SPOR domain-containing protein [Chromobacterium vaccinii]|uniref:SPOR domain-containing protein n=1 Tax=Chromobacterium vaccinii TaxID=1108595 RepID=A0ABV0FEA7_9NEIS
MREQNQQQQPYDGEDESNLNGKLKKRLWIAGGLVAVALAAIPLMDALTKPKVEMSSDAQSPSSGKIIKPASSADSGAITVQIKPASAPAAQSSAPAAETANRAPASPTETIPATPDLSKTPAVANQQPPHRAAPPTAHAQQQAAPQAPAAKPATPPFREALAKPPAQRAAAPRAETAAATPQSTAAMPQSAAPAPAEISPTPTAATPSPAKAEPAGSSVGYQVQLGLFSSMGNAQKLVRDLQKHGIAAHTVTRVQLGPFKNRAEADEAMKKLRELGYSPLLAAGGQ